MRLAAFTGLRRADLVRLSWSHIDAGIIEITTEKSQRKVLIPIEARLRQLISEIPKRATTVLTSTRDQPWIANGLSSTFYDVRAKAGLSHLRFHDLRGTAATRFYTAGIETRDIAEIMGWSEKSVQRLVDRYVNKHARHQAIADQLDEYADRTESAKPLAKSAPKSG